jgi:hypothetical protein
VPETVPDRELEPEPRRERRRGRRSLAGETDGASARAASAD